ncbi:PCMD domain-containing protein [uncultured Alistipes sp.]|uniref:PCMD domain-containing protein n=1 Tax=uncultured Alistipes sp. TaxID=538949 RepID=UPI00261FB5BC|nr:PCMD domain-containing protein [uncultured Alistipes sp.]
MKIAHIRTFLACAAALALSACIRNDVPYPVVELQITDVRGEGFTVGKVDLGNRQVTLQLDEQTDIRNVRIDDVTLDAKIHSVTLDKEQLLGKVQTSQPLTGTFDLRTPLYVTLSLYQDYDWTITAEQTIERRFAVEGQIGATTFDAENRIATATVGKETDLAALTVTELKLGPADITTYSPTLEELSGSNFETVRFVDVTCHGRTEQWTLDVQRTDQSVTLRQADAWTRVIWLYGEGIAGSTMGFSYRKAGDEQWTRIASDDADSPVEVTGGSFTLRLTVEPLTTYEVKAFCGDEESAVRTLTTEGEQQLPNCDLETWSKPKNPWLPFASDDSGNPIDPFWGSGNNGATVISSSDNLTTPVTDLHPEATGKYSARLESRYVVMKLAAGNLFTGEFVGIRSLSHGIVNFGRPFTLRPTALRLWMKYTCGQIDNAKDIGSVPVGESIQVGDYDTGSIYIALGTWTKEEYGYGKDHELFGTDESPVSIDTRDASTFFDPNGKDVIGYGGRYFHESVDEWTQITIPIEYSATDKRPTHIVVVCSASRLGDYFTGSRNSRMWIDDIELLYD